MMDPVVRDSAGDNRHISRRSKSSSRTYLLPGAPPYGHGHGDAAPPPSPSGGRASPSNSIGSNSSSKSNMASI